jgi:hypothetical protein
MHGARVFLGGLSVTQPVGPGSRVIAPLVRLQGLLTPHFPYYKGSVPLLMIASPMHGARVFLGGLSVTQPVGLGSRVIAPLVRLQGLLTPHFPYHKVSVPLLASICPFISTVGAFAEACSLPSPFPKDRGADADVGGAFFDGDGVVAAHAHAEVGHGCFREGGEFVPELAQGAEPGAGLLRIIAGGWHGHETHDFEAFEAQ